MTEQYHTVRRVSRREAMKGTGVALGSLVASGTLTDTVMAQSGGPTDEISGIVEDESGAVQGATVVAVPHDTSLSALETTTASDGTYIFEQSDLHEDENLYHVIARDGSEAAPRRGQQNYPFIAAEGPAAIPDSVVMQYYATTWTQGDGTWNDDADTAQDMSITGDPQDGTLSDGSESVVLDGVDDYGLVALPSEFDGAGMNQFTVEFAFGTTDTTEAAMPVGVVNGTNQRLEFQLNRDETLSADSGNIAVNIEDSNGNALMFAPSSNPNLTDGNRHDVSIIVNDAANNDGDMIIDGTTQSLSFGATAGPSSWNSWSYDAGHGARNVTGTAQNFLEFGAGAYRWHDSAITTQTISDYP